MADKVDMARLKGCTMEVLGDQALPHQGVSAHRVGENTVLTSSTTLASGQEVALGVEVPNNISKSEFLVNARSYAPEAGRQIEGTAYFAKGNPLTGTPATYSNSSGVAPASAETLKGVAQRTAAKIGACFNKS